MPYTVDAAGRSRLSPDTPPGAVDSLDRILLGVCAAIWLVALGAGVAATVALVDLGRGHPGTSDDAATPWLLYTVIGVSAAVIIAAVPLLLRARRSAVADPQPARATTAAPPTPGPPPILNTEAATEKIRPRPGYPAPPASTGTVPMASVAAVDQLWLRCAVLIACAMGAAMVLIGVATYLMAVDSNGPAWIVYGLAGLVTLGMPAIPWFYLRELRGVQDASAGS